MRDLELLLNKIHNSTVRSYYQEAIACYNVSSYRAAIILAVSTGMEDLFNKMESINKRHRDEESKRDDARIQQLFASIGHIKSLKNNNKSWERELIQFYGRSSFSYDGKDYNGLNVFSKSEREDLEHCFNIRNNCAHLSSEQPSSEKARFVITTMIDLISSREMILGYVHLENLLERISHPYFFPSSAEEDKNRRIVQEMNAVLPRSHKFFVQELFKKLESGEVHANYYLFASQLLNVLSADAKDEYRRSLSNLLEQDSFVAASILGHNFELISQLELDVDLLFSFYKNKFKPNLHKVLSEMKLYNEDFVSTKCKELIEDESIDPKDVSSLAPLANLLLQGGQELKESYIRFLIKWIDYSGGNDYFSKTGVQEHFQSITVESIRELENAERFYLVVKLVIIYLNYYQSASDYYMSEFKGYVRNIDDSILCRDLCMSEQDYQTICQADDFLNEIYGGLYKIQDSLCDHLQDNPNLKDLLNGVLDHFSVELKSKEKETFLQECGVSEEELQIDLSNEFDHVMYIIEERKHYNFLKE